MADDAVLDELVAYTTSLEFEDIDPNTLETTKLRLFDSIVSAVLSLDSEPIEDLIRYSATKDGERSARLLGTDATAGLEYASFANGSMIRFLDWNDTYLAAEAAHPSCNVGAILAVADAERLSGREVLRATVAAYDAQCTLCDLASFTDNGFDHVNYGLVSVPLSVGSAMGLSRSQLADAVNIALSSHLGVLQSRSGTLTAWKGLAFGNASRNGVVAAELAENDFDGPSPIFTGEHGLNRVLSSPIDPAEVGFDDGFRINETHLKRYPICHHILGAVDAVFELLGENAIDPERIESIEVQTYDIAVQVTAGPQKWRPTTRSTADHSLPYCVARSLLDGTIGPEQLSPDGLQDDDVVELMDRVTVTENDSHTESYGDTFAHTVSIATEAQTYERTVEYPMGHYENPLSYDDVQRKLVAHSDCSTEDAARLRDEIERLETADDVSDLLDLVAEIGGQISTQPDL